MCVYIVEISGKKKPEGYERLSQNYWTCAKQQTFYVVLLHFFSLSQSYQVGMQAIDPDVRLTGAIGKMFRSFQMMMLRSII